MCGINRGSSRSRKKKTPSEGSKKMDALHHNGVSPSRRKEGKIEPFPRENRSCGKSLAQRHPQTTTHAPPGGAHRGCGLVLSVGGDAVVPRPSGEGTCTSGCKLGGRRSCATMEWPRPCSEQTERNLERVASFTAQNKAVGGTCSTFSTYSRFGQTPPCTPPDD